MASYLADTSAWAVAQRHGAPTSVKARFGDLLRRGAIATCGPVKWELLHSTRNAVEFAARRANLNALDQAMVHPQHWEEALDICEALARQGGTLHRAVKLPDTVIAVAARHAGLTVLHYDEDFDRITTVTGQPVEWVAPRGSL